MKTQIKLPLLLVISLFLISSCKKDEEVIFAELINPTSEEMQSFKESGCNTITGDVQLSDINYLHDFLFMSNVERIGGSFSIIGNSELLSFNGLNNLRKVEGSLIITNNGEITNMEGLYNLKTIGGLLHIADEEKLINFQGLDRLEHFESLFIEHCNINSLEGLPSMQSIDGFLKISNCPVLTSLEELSSIEHVKGPVLIQGIKAIQDLSGLRRLVHIGNYLGIYENDFVNMQGMDNLIKVDGNIQIYNNENLYNLDGFISLEIMNGIFVITNNHVLSDLCGIRNILLNSSVDTVYINQNAFNPTFQDIIAGNCSQ